MTTVDKSEENGKGFGEAEVISEPTAEGAARTARDTERQRDQGKGDVILDLVTLNGDGKWEAVISSSTAAPQTELSVKGLLSLPSESLQFKRLCLLFCDGVGEIKGECG